MHGSGNTTVDVAVDDPRPATPELRSVLGLVYLWNKREPHRAGEVALLDPKIGSVWVYGRETGEEDRLGRGRIRFSTQPPRRFTRGRPVVGEGASREQLAA